MTRFSTAKSQRLIRLSKEGFWIVLGQAGAVVGSLVGVRVITGLLDPVAYGELALGLTLSALVNQAVLGPLGNGVTRFYSPAAERGDLAGYFRAVYRLVLLATALVGAVTLIVSAGLFLFGRGNLLLISVMALLFAVVSGYSGILSGIQNAARQRAIVAFHQGVEPWVRFLVAAGLMVILGSISAVAMCGYAIALVLVVASQSLFFRKVFGKQAYVGDKGLSWNKQVWGFTWPIAIFGSFTWLQLASDRWALSIFASTQDVGLYAVLFQLGYYPMTLVTGIMMQFMAPVFYQRAGDASDGIRNAKVAELNWRMVALILGGTFLTFFPVSYFHKQIFGLFVAGNYSLISYLMPWMLLAGGVFAAGQTAALNLQCQMKMQIMMRVKITTAVCGVGLNFIGAYLYGIEGVVGAGVLFSLFYFLWMALLLKADLKKAGALNAV